MKDIIKKMVNKHHSTGGISKKKLIKLVGAEINDDNDNNDNNKIDKIKDMLDSLVTKGKIHIDDENVITLVKDKASKKRKLSEVSEENEEEMKSIENDIDIPSSSTINPASSSSLKNQKSIYYDDLWKNGEKYYREGTLSAEYNSTNPDGITRLFCGNLNKNVTEEQLKQCINDITYIKWITDKTTKEFYGSTFLEMKDPKAAITAVLQDGTKFLGRPLKIYYCPPKPGDVWPPIKGSGSGSGLPSSGDKGHDKTRFVKEKTPKPLNGKKLFIGNLSYDIDDDTIVNFFKDCGELVGLRWLVNQHTGDFRGGGYIEFATTEEADVAFQLDGTILMGRPIRIDWTE